MLEHGSYNSLPAKYRIALALSSAFLIHTLLLSGVPSVLPDLPARHQQKLSLELISAQSPSSAPASPFSSDPGNRVVHRNLPFEITPDSKAVAKKPTTQTQKRLAEPVVASSSSGAEAAPKPESRKQPAISQSSSEVARITQSPAEQDPYLIKLAMHLAAKLETLRIPEIRELTRSSAMELELQLLNNGALTRVRVINSTGIEPIDNAAYRAALSASPYPEPPPEQSGKNRFEVKLVFSPSRL